MPEPDWHGWSIRRGEEVIGYHVGRHPARKSVVLMRTTPGLVEAAAYFRTEEHAEAFLDWLDTLAAASPRIVETIEPDATVL